MKYNLNKLASPFISVISPSEIFNNITNDIVEGIYPYYMISNFGRIYHKYTGKFLKPGWETSGYLFVALSTNLGPKNCLVHRLVMKSFNPIINHNELQVNHINGDKTCNILDNLEWCTRSYNQKHAYSIGLHQRNSKLTENDVYKICDLLMTNLYTISEISKICNGISEHIISDIKKKQTWKYITEKYDFEHRPGKLFSDEDLIKICMYFQSNPKPDNMYIKDFCKIALTETGFDNSERYVDSIRKLYTRKNFNHISKYYKY